MPDESWSAKVREALVPLSDAAVADTERDLRLCLEMLEEDFGKDVTVARARLAALMAEVIRWRAIAREMVERADGYPATPVADACLFCGHFEEEPEKHAPGCPWPLLLLSLPPERT